MGIELFLEIAGC